MRSVFEKPKVFISHGKARQDTLNHIFSFLQIIEVEPIVVIAEPNQSLGVGEKVIKYIQECDCVLVLATPDNKSAWEFQPRANVSHEIGYAQAIEKNIIYLKDKRVSFGSNYGDRAWLQFTEGANEAENTVFNTFPQIIDELKRFNLIHITGKLNQDRIKVEMVDKLYDLTRLMGINDVTVKANLLHLLGMALYLKGQDLTAIEQEEIFEIYPELRMTCAMSGYRHESISEARKFISFSLQLSESEPVLVDYLVVLAETVYQGEGMFDDEIIREINDILVKLIRLDAYYDERLLKKVLLFLQLLNERNRLLFWSRFSNSDRLPLSFLNDFKSFIFNNIIDEEFDFNKIPTYFTGPVVHPPVLKSFFDYSTQELIFKFLSKHFSIDDLSFYENILLKPEAYYTDLGKREGYEPSTFWEAKAIWAVGENHPTLTANLYKAFSNIFKSKNHTLIGILATALGKMKCRQFDDELIEALHDFDVASRRRIIWAIGQFNDKSFLPVINTLSISKENYALYDEYSRARELISAS